MKHKTTTEPTTEQRATDTLLEAPRTITIGSHTYTTHPATLATIIKVSGIASQIPTDTLDLTTTDNAIATLLHHAPHTIHAPHIIATLIAGTHSPTAKWHTRLLYKWRYQRILRQITPHLTPATTYKALTELLPLLEIDHFFALTAFLTHLNMIPRGAEPIETETTHGA